MTKTVRRPADADERGEAGSGRRSGRTGPTTHRKPSEGAGSNEPRTSSRARSVSVPSSVGTHNLTASDLTASDLAGMRVNGVLLTGRVTRAPIVRELPSGDSVAVFRLSVPRDSATRGRKTVDWFDCAVWTARLRRTVGVWTVGDTVTVTGRLRRRDFVVSATHRTLVEVEVRTARRLTRGDAEQSTRAP